MKIKTNGESLIVPYTQETIRECLEGYTLSPCVGNLEKETYINLDSVIKGCFVSRFSKLFAIAIFKILASPSSPFSFLVNRVTEKKCYTNLKTKTFNITASNKNAFYINLEIQSDKKSKVESWSEKEKSKFLERTYIYDGKTVFADGINFPLVYRFDINGDYTELKKLTLDLYMPMTDENGEPFKTIEKLELDIDRTDGLKLEANNLVPINDMCDVTAPDTNLVRRKYKILGDLKLIVKNEKEYEEIIVWDFMTYLSH